ncbi:MAG: CsbD family protein [Proteobacteria bacterium]|nr:MAG: CsbD family protein [Pseudomonadota bacterium]RYZ75750.1 MAG: CsbD family protein [Pseudomonadota bacterium]
MNWDQIEGQWKDLKGTVREKWAKFTDDDVELIAGKKDRFVGKLQERYGLAKDRAELELDDYINGMNKDKSKLS